MFKQCATVIEANTKPEKKSETVFTGIKMDRPLYRKARRRAKQLHQDYSNYVRQLIVRDLDPSPKYENNR